MNWKKSSAGKERTNHRMRNNTVSNANIFWHFRVRLGIIDYFNRRRHFYFEVAQWIWSFLQEYCISMILFYFWHSNRCWFWKLLLFFLCFLFGERADFLGCDFPNLQNTWLSPIYNQIAIVCILYDQMWASSSPFPPLFLILMELNQ